MAEELPVLIAALAADTARGLAETARVGGDVWVRLDTEPTRDGFHVLEVFTAESDTPVRLLAEPLGMGSEHGTALRLHPWPAAKPAAPPPPSQRRTSLAGGRFELISKLGEGAIGAVYRARHTGLNTSFAVKVLHPAFQADAEFCRRFYAEALAMSRLNHANLISVNDFGQEPDGLLYIAMAYIEGITLRDLLHRERSFDVPRIVSWMLQICAGLHHAHARGLIHRDVKPDNVMIVTQDDDDGQRVEIVKILDFGFAVPPSSSGQLAERLAGTPVYMSPEQCRGEELDGRSDLYACGIMMFELATGTPPFLTNDPASLREMHMNAPIPRISAKRPDIDPRYERIVQRALSKRREDRQASMMELRSELKDLLLPESLPAIPVQKTRIEPAPASSRAPAPPKPEEDWLERGTSYDMHTASAATILADKLTKDASAWLGELTRERNPRALTVRIEELGAAIRIIAARADAKTLSRVSAVVAGLGERMREEAARNALADVARLFVNPDILGPVATNLLLRETEAQATSELLARARISGAVALYGARTKPGITPRGRIVFVTTMKSLGTSARPVLRAALERLSEQPATREAMELAEDVLFSVPKGEDDLIATLAAKFASGNVASVARAAARALPRVAGLRARSVLLNLVQHSDDGVSLAAIVGLHELEVVDHDAVVRIAAQVDAGRVRTQQIRAVFATALGGASASARDAAMAVIARLPR